MPPVDTSSVRSLSARRAWIEIIMPPVDTSSVRSLSARRAWIEINHWACLVGFAFVALRKESVDRNKRSPTAGQLGAVALRKESVDRNTNDRRYCIAPVSRSPQGERG